MVISLKQHSKSKSGGRWEQRPALPMNPFVSIILYGYVTEATNKIRAVGSRGQPYQHPHVSTILYVCYQSRPQNPNQGLLGAEASTSNAPNLFFEGGLGTRRKDLGVDT